LAFFAELLVKGDFALGAEEVLAEVGVGVGFFGGDEAADAEEGDGFEEAVNFLGGGEGAGGFGEFGGGYFLGRGFVGAAEAGIGGADGLGALASCGGAMLAAGKGWFWFGLKETEIHFGIPAFWGHPPVFG